MASHKMFCVKCRNKKICSHISYKKGKSGRVRMCGVCNSCGSKTSQFVSSKSMSKSRKSRSKSRKSRSKSRARKH